MKKITTEIRTSFQILQTDGKLAEIIKYLSDILSTDNADKKLSGFCLWNISDSFAMLRMAEDLYNNHLRFFNLLETMPNKFKFWSVCDTTQRFTLELGGYGDFWWELYKNAIEVNPDTSDTECIRFETHRAALSCNPKIQTSSMNIEFARQNFYDFLNSLINKENSIFYKLIYTSLCMRIFGTSEFDILSLCNELLPHLKEHDIQSQYAVGEWERLNSQRTPKNKAQVGINTAINSFIDTDKKVMAKELYETAKKYGFTPNIYIEQRL